VLHGCLLLQTSAAHSQTCIFGRPFLKRFALSYLSVTLVYCGQTVGWIKMLPFGTEVGLGPGHIALDGDPSPPPPKGHSPQFSAHVCCGQTTEWISMPLVRKVGLGPCDVVLDGDPAPPSPKGAQPPQLYSPQFSVYVYCVQAVSHLSYC